MSITILILCYKDCFTSKIIRGFDAKIIAGYGEEKIAELFGYQGLTEKFSGVIGPFLFGYIATSFGFKPALLVVIGLFLLGAFVLSLVKIKTKP